jgi:hypothetical protein
LVQVEDFVREQSKNAPTQAVPTAIFYLQTLGLILQDAEFFGLLGALNLDLESATGQCVAPLTTAGRFYAKATLTPLVLVVATVVFAPRAWNLCRRMLPQCVWDKAQAPAKATAVHIKRTLISVYLFCYSPLTQSAIELLICVPTCSDAACPEVLSIDFGVTCDGAEYHSGVGAAVRDCDESGTHTVASLVRRSTQ